MKHLVLLAIPLVVAGCAQSPLDTSTLSPSPGSMESSSTSRVYSPTVKPQPAEPQPSAEVRDAQRQLRTLGLYDGPLDGLYGSGTQQAVERFQTTYRLPATERLDSTTLAALEREAMLGNDPVPLADPTHVRTMQNRLRQLGFYSGTADGVWGPDTQVALEHFQRARGLPIGQVTRPTLLAMDLQPSSFTTPTGTTAATGGAYMGEPLEPVVVEGIQRRLRETGFYDGPVDGVWGPGTQAALEQFQRSWGLESAGNLNPMTAAALGLDPNNLAASATELADRPAN